MTPEERAARILAGAEHVKSVVMAASVNASQRDAELADLEQQLAADLARVEPLVGKARRAAAYTISTKTPQSAGMARRRAGSRST